MISAEYFRQKRKDFYEELIKNKIILQAVLVGLVAGILVVLFKLAIDSLFYFIQTQVAAVSWSERLLLLPLITTFGGLISGLLVFKLAPETRGSGIPYVKLVLTKIGSVIRLRSIFVKFFAGVFGIGCGLPLGREGPSVQLGAGAGSLVGRIFDVNALDKDKLIAAGAGSAIGATFNAPIAGTIFVLEELLQKFYSFLLFPVLAATVTAASFARYFLGNHPAFTIPSLDKEMSVAGIFVSIILGFLSGILGVYFAKLIYFSQNLFERYKKLPNWLKPALAGLVVGLVGLVLPEVLGTGNNAVGLLLQHKLTLGMIILIFIGKFVLTPLCFGSGAAGGIFLPILMLGSFLGYLLASFFNLLGLEINVVAVSLVGMAAFLSAVARTPITAVVMVFEMTAGYTYILPIMLSAAIADLTAKRLHHKPIYLKLMLKQSQNTPEALHLSKMTARSIMSENVRSFPCDMSIEEALEAIKTEGYAVYPVVDKKNKFMGSVTRSDINDALILGNDGTTTVEKIMNPKAVVAYPDTDLYTIYFRLRLNNSERAIITDRRKNIKGIITRGDIHIAAAPNSSEADKSNK